MPQFFVPTPSESEPESDYKKLRDSIQISDLPLRGKLSDERIFRIDYRHNGERHEAEVGKFDTASADLVLAIFKQQDYGLYFIYMERRGIALVGESAALSVTDFDRVAAR